jgi:hypothetical protein
MPSLRELQTLVVNGLLAEQSDGAAALIRSGGILPESRLRIYQNNARTNFAAALRSTYPVICRLVGEDYFRQTAWAFQRRHPSHSGDLNHAGGAFPDYLRALHSRGDFQYLADVATLEWLIQESLLAPDHAPLNLQDLAGVDTPAYDVLHFTLHPTLRLFASQFPALRIWEANVEETEPPALDLAGSGEYLAVMRHEGQLRFHRLSLGEYTFLQSLTDGGSVTASVEGGAAADPDFDATLGLQRFVAANAIVDFALHVTRL